MVNQMEVGVD